MTVQVAARAGAEVIAVVGRPAKLSYVPDQAKAVLAADLTAEAAGGPVDALIDTVGGPVLTSALRLVRPRGRAALVGYTAGREFTVDLAHFLLADVSVLPVNLLSRSRELVDVGDRLLAEISAGTLRLPIERFGLDELAVAVERLRGGEIVGKAVFSLA
jgi:NADPH:quinone reductase-like Zn-dependent oxidoreductase